MGRREERKEGKHGFKGDIQEGRGGGGRNLEDVEDGSPRYCTEDFRYRVLWSTRGTVSTI